MVQKSLPYTLYPVPFHLHHGRGNTTVYFIWYVLHGAWDLLLESSVYIIFGLLVSGLLRVFLNPSSIAHHLGRDRFLSVFKAALLGIPIPL